MRTELVINGTRVDVTDEVSLALTYAIADIKNPDKRMGSHSKTVKLPGTKVVNELLSHVFEVNLNINNTTATNFNPGFNANLKASAVVYVDYVEQFRGYMRLRKITRERQDLGRITYEVELYGELANIINELGYAMMTDIDLSDLDHTYTKANQLASWSVVNASGGYVYPMIQHGDTDGVNWNVTELYPAVFLKTLWDRVCEYAGRSYSSSFLTASPFNKLILPYIGDQLQLPQASITDRLFEAELATYTSGTLTVAGETITPYIFDTDISDPSNQYDTGTGQFTTAKSGFYEFTVSGNFYVTAVTSMTIPGGFGIPLNLQFRQNGVAYEIASVPNLFQNLTAGNSTSTVTFSYTTASVYLSAGDVIDIVASVGAVSGSTGTFTWTFDNATFKNSVNNPVISEGDDVYMDACLPTDVRMADFFMDVVKIFNLMVEPDRSNPSKLYIEPAPDFYGSGTLRDWTDKLDVSKPFDIFPMGALDARRYTLKWKDTPDYHNKLYSDTWAKGYGEKNHDVENDFQTNENVYTSLFSPTPLVNNGTDDRVYPYIYTIDSNGNPKPTKGGMRLLYWGGLKSTGYQWNYIDNSGATVRSTYPYAGHLDDIDNPTFDLNFTNPREVYYNAVNYTDGNLWNRYHDAYISEITDKDSKIVSAYFYLKPLDILRLSFRDPIYVDGTYYRLHKIVDYDPTKEQTTRVELLKIKNAPTFTAATYSIANYYGSTTAVVVGGQSRPRTIASNGVSLGSGNQVNESNLATIVSGRDNTVGANSERVTILGSSGVTVYPNLSNVTVINTNDVTVTESDTVWVNGSRYTQGANNAYTINTSQTITGAGTYYCSGTMTLTLSTSVLSAQDIIQVFNMGPGTVTIAGGGINILQSPATASASITSTQQYDSITLRYNGTNYIIQ